MEVMAIVGLLALFIWWQINSKKKKAATKQEKMQALIGESKGFKPAFCETFCDDSFGLSIDPKNERMAVVAEQEQQIFEFAQIVGYEALVNGQVVQKGSGNRSDAVLGGIVASGGAAGAIAAMVAADKNKIKSVSLRILTTDLIKPWVEVSFFNEKEGKARKNPVAQKALEQCKGWEGRITALIDNKVRANSLPNRAGN